MIKFFIKWGVAFALLALTFNPTPWNAVRWGLRGFDGQMPLGVLAIVVLVIGYAIYLRATLRSIGGAGLVLVAALVGALGWVLFDWGVLSFANPTANLWLALIAVSFVMGIGLHWSIIRRAISGQYDVDDPDN